MSTVNPPKHYNEHPSGVECIDIVEGFNFNVGNAIKYLWRAGLKSDNPIEDLEKAAWYCNREIERLIEEAARTAVQPKPLTHQEAQEWFANNFGDSLRHLGKIEGEPPTAAAEFHIQFHTHYEPQDLTLLPRDADGLIIPVPARTSMAGCGDHLT